MTEKEAELEKELALLTEHKNKLDKEINELKTTINLLKNCLKKCFNSKLHEKPIYVWHTKKRNNTTIKFMDGSVTTVKKAKGEKDCLETAIVYALVKHKYGKKTLEKLVSSTKEVK